MKNLIHGTLYCHRQGCRCDKCRKAATDYQRERRNKREDVRLKDREGNRKRSQELYAFVAKLKTGKPCADCGVSYPHYVMQFDHLGEEPKLGNIGTMSRNSTEEKILVEVAKCELVCANCHAERTHQRNEKAY